MPSFYKTILTVLANVFCIISTLQSQKLNLQFTPITTENGLTSNTVTDVIQDNKGFIWIATGNGLQRFDGLRFTTWRAQLNNPRSLTSDIVGKLLEDDKGNIWVACHNGVSRINQYRQPPERIQVEHSTNELLIEPIQFFQDSKKNIWLVTRPHGIFKYEAASNKFVPINKIYPFKNWKSFSMTEDVTTGNFWLGGDSGIAYIDVTKKQVYNYNYNPKKIALLSEERFYHTPILGMKMDNADTLWFNISISDYPRSTKNSYESYNYNTTSGALVQFEPLNKTPYNYALDNDNKLWLLGENIFSVRTENKFVKIPVDGNDPYGLRATLVNSFFEDKDHNRWLGTNIGIFVFNTDEVKIGRGAAFNDNKERENLTPQQFLQLPNKNIWMATVGLGIMEYDSNFNPIKRISIGNELEDENYNMVWSMTLGRDQKVWIGCQSGKLLVYDLSKKSFTKLAPPQFELRTIRTSAVDANSNIWFGTQHGLLIKYEIKTNTFSRFSTQDFPAKESYGNINKLIVDNRNDLWACTDGGGLLRINTTTGKLVESFVHSENDKNSLSSNGTHNIIQYNDSIYVISSSMGINLLNIKTRKFSHITTSDGLPTNSANSLKKDWNNHIWAGLNGVLVRISIPSNNVTTFGKKEGIFHEVFQTNAMEILSDGRIVAGTTDDFIYFNPDQFSSSRQPSKVYITGFKVFNQEINFDSILSKQKRIILPFNQNFIRIEFSPMGFLNDKINIYYKLDGLEKDWVRSTSDLSANYANLQGGTYKFLIKSVNGDGISSKINSIDFYIRPPFWETWWFLFLLALIAAAALYVAHRTRVNRLIGMEAVRSRIARDLHDDMGSTLSTINILSEMAQMKIDNDIVSTKSYITKIGDNCSRMMEAMDDIVWSINPMNDNMQKITARMREYAANILEAKDISYSFQIDDAVKGVVLDMEARRDFFLIFKEALNNLAKYSECKRAEIKIEVYEYTMCMKIQDDGKGFIVKEADNGNGLSNMAKRAQNVNAKFNIESHPGVGTKILLEVNFA